MKEYAFTILMIAAMITLVAVAAGTIVYLRATRGAHSLTFQLSRIGIVWGTLIILLLLVGLFGFTVKEWTVASLGDVAGWFKERDLFHYALYWMQNNRLISSALLWGGGCSTYLRYALPRRQYALGEHYHRDAACLGFVSNLATPCLAFHQGCRLCMHPHLL